MKRLSRSERNGALALAGVSLLVVCGAFFYRQCRSATSHSPGSASGVTIILGDTARSQDAGAAGRRPEGARVPKARGGHRSGRPHKRPAQRGRAAESSRQTPPVRDLLSDTVPVSTSCSK